MSIISYYTELDIEMCKMLIDLQIKSESYQRSGIRGKVDFYNNKFKLSKPRRDGRYRVFYGELIKEVGGTTINGEFQSPMDIVILRVLSFMFIMLIWLNSLFDIILGTSNDNTGSMLVLILLAIILGFAALIIMKFGYVEEEENHILYIIATKLNATFINNIS